MGWIIKSTGDAYDGDTHEFMGSMWSGATKTEESVKLIWEEGEEILIEDDPEPTPKPRRGRPKKSE
jgi:hypothetical protein